MVVSKTCCPPETKLGLSMWSTLKGLVKRRAYTGARLAAWISFNFATATYSKTTNSLSAAYNGNRLTLNDLELRQQFPDAADYPLRRALGQRRPVQRERGVNPVEVAVRREETVGQADLVDGKPGVALQVQGLSLSTSKSLSEPATLLRLST